MAGNGSEASPKRHQNASEEKEALTASKSSSPPTLSLPHFTAPSCLSPYWKLPRELQHRIVALACGPPIIPRSRIVGRSVDCTATTLLLMRTSRFFYAQAAPLLYRHVRVSRPSMLHAFHQSIAARPSLGQLVRSLHIGSDEALPDDWFPIRESDCGTAGHIAFTLKLPDEIDSKDWTCCVEHEPDHVDDESEQAAQAFRQALVSASKALDVNLYRHNLDFSNNDISSNAWHIRVLEVQAAVELHSIELRRCALTTQKRAKAKKIDINSDQDLQVTFPRLEVATDAVAASVRASRGVFRVTRTQIWARILSSGSPADRFDHPLLFARSGFKWLALGPDDVIHRGRAVRNFSEAEEIADVFSMLHSSVVPVLAQDGRSVRPSTPGPPDPLNLQRLTTATVGGCLALARCVLSLTPHVRNLSLTGFLQRAVASERAPCHQPLQCLTLGPHAPRWNEALQLTHSAFGGLKKLRICGGLLVDEEIDSIRSANGALPHLEIMSWDMVSKFDASECY